MPIYTHCGDSGETDLFPWGRVRKTDARMETLGNLDELNASLGVIRSLVKDGEIDQKLDRFQHVIVQISSEISCNGSGQKKRSFLNRKSTGWRVNCRKSTRCCFSTGFPPRHSRSLRGPFADGRNGPSGGSKKISRKRPSRKKFCIG